uniref:ATP synthase complex subunit 8 n=1 Tax=Orsodacne cerasi TaxID=558334 RepID=A0A343C1S1_9CUCU|nr:ATP synthase F0 subunit 8 [Orsodacne cerasi]
MPQMAPLNWLMLFWFFIMIYMIFNSMNYFSFLYEPKFKFMTKKIIKINWKW